MNTNPRKIMLTAVACGLAIGMLGGAQVNTVPRVKTEMPFRWAEGGWTPPREAMQFADSVPLDLDVPSDFQLSTVAVEGDAASMAQATGQVPRADWAALRLAQYKVEAPRPLPAPASYDAPAREEAAATDVARIYTAANADRDAASAGDSPDSDAVAPRDDEAAADLST